MNKASKSPRAKWQKIGWAALLVLIVGYHFGRPTLEKVTGLSLPALDGSQRQVEVKDQNPTEDSNESETGRSNSNDRSLDGVAGTKSGEASETGEFPLKKIGRNRYQTPAGLIYGMGPRGEHRIDHVMLHSEDEPDKHVHGVFLSKDKSEVLQMIDDAYQRIKKKSRGVKTSQSGDRGDRVEYTVEMDRKIGFEGGKSGARKKHPALRKIKLVLQSGNQVITAFPYR